jgi:hypothetical protein
MNAREITRRLDRYLVDWRGLLRANVAQGRQVLRRLVDGRLTFSPQLDFYTFQGAGAVQPVIAGVVQKLASPPGSDTNWNSVHTHVSSGMITA